MVKGIFVYSLSLSRSPSCFEVWPTLCGFSFHWFVWNSFGATWYLDIYYINLWFVLMKWTYISYLQEYSDSN